MINTQPQINNTIEESYKRFDPIQHRVEQINRLCDTKTSAAKSIVAGKNITPAQEERYSRKYELAKRVIAGDKQAEALLSVEAKAAGTTSKKLAQTIVQKGDKWNAAVDRFVLLIETFRQLATSKVDAMDDNAFREMLSKADALGAGATEADVLALFN